MSVRDTGIGMSAGNLERVFEMFVRGEHADERAQNGLGIGLALARQLTEMHGGSLHATSDGIGRGSQFTLRLPLVNGHLDAGSLE